MAELTNGIMRSGFLPSRIIHLHPTRLCNLACLHCYSASGPKEKAALSADDLSDALLLLKDEGYEQISLSGGEPMAYPHLAELIKLAKNIGYKVTMITNGTYPVKRIQEVVTTLDGAAVSFDGLAAVHNEIRGRKDAYEKGLETLTILARSGLPVAAAVCVGPNTLPDLPDLVIELAETGVRVIQIRPVADAGRAKNNISLHNFTEAALARLYLVVLALQEEFLNEVKIHCDLAPAKKLWLQREDYAALLTSCTDECNTGKINVPLSELVNPLVITETGTLKPIAYDFNPSYNISNVKDLNTSSIENYKLYGVQSLKQLIGHLLVTLQNKPGFVDWFDHCARSSELHQLNTQQIPEFG